MTQRRAQSLDPFLPNLPARILPTPPSLPLPCPPRHILFNTPVNYSAEVSVRLGHIGDQVFALVITDLIQGLYPHLRVGPASVRQSPVIRNKSHLTSRLSRKSEII